MKNSALLLLTRTLERPRLPRAAPLRRMLALREERPSVRVLALLPVSLPPD